MQVEAIFVFCGYAYRRELLYVFTGAGLACTAAVYAATRALEPLEASVAAFCAPLALLVVWRMLARRGRALRFSDYFVAFSYLLLFVALCDAGLTAPGTGPDGGLVDGPAQTIFYALMYTAVVCTQASFVVMTKEESDFRLMQLATLDPLAEIWNRRTFIEAAEAELRRCARKRKPCAIVLFDLDNFKKINDTYGHAVGDAVIRDFAANVRAMLREYDLVGRYGGEEFTVLLPETNAADAAVTADRIRERCGTSELSARGERVAYSASAGVALTGERLEAFDELLARADAALYEAKAQGRNRIVVAAPVSAA
jgi:diguanylate cyclase (GGDEF)-like protein